MVFAVLPLFITAGLGAPALAVGIVEGVADGSAAVVKLWSGWYSDRIAWRKSLAVGGYGTTVVGLALLIAVTSWPQVIIARALAWMGRGLRQPIRSAMLAGSVGKSDLGKAFGFHEALDTAGALLGPAIAFILLAGGHGFRTVFAVAVIPGVVAVIFFGILTRDPRHGRGEPVSLRVPLPGSFWRLIAAVAVFGVGNFATAFFTLRAAQMLQPELSRPVALSAAVGFYLAHNAVGAAVSFPAGWLADRIGKVPVLASAYLTFAAASVVGMLGHGWLAVALLALFVGAQNPAVISMESSLTSSIVEERR
ncbi:MAG TPA: MFS transporter, partial [Methylomirabilota bacterium]|nr:MFS transporter [Methylomirabilota bacterium]